MSEESTQLSPDDSHVAINLSQINEELIHKAEDAQLVDPNEPKPGSNLYLVKIAGWDFIWIVFGIFWAAASGTVPLVFFWYANLHGTHLIQGHG
jgi:hypothetical protein